MNWARSNKNHFYFYGTGPKKCLILGISPKSLNRPDFKVEGDGIDYIKSDEGI